MLLEGEEKKCLNANKHKELKMCTNTNMYK